MSQLRVVCTLIIVSIRLLKYIRSRSRFNNQKYFQAQTPETGMHVKRNADKIGRY